MPDQSKTPFLLVDGSSYLFRAFHALPSLVNSKGEPTGAIYGVVNMLRRLLERYKPQHLAVVFDAKGKNFRHELYGEYKANRPPMPDELRVQIEPLHEVVRAMGLPLLIIDGVEADDVIGTLARQASASKTPVVISTGDKDMAQLVNEHVTLINTMTDTLLDPQGVLEKFGVKPEQIIDYLALVGDSSDNIPGVPKVGPKTAVKWLASYESMNNIIAHAAEIKGKVGENLRVSLDQLTLSYELATIKCDVELDETPETLCRHAEDHERLIELFQGFGFKSWLNKLQSEPVANEDNGDAQSKKVEEEINRAQYDTIFGESVFEEWLQRLEQAELFSFDLETTSLDYMEAEIVGVSFSVEPGEAAYVPVAHDYIDVPEQLKRDFVLEKLRPLLENETPKKVGQNLKYDMSVLANYGITLKGIAFDTMLESYVLNSTATRHNMDALAEKYLNYQTTHFEDIAGKGGKQLTFNQIAIEQAAPYAAEDADVTLRLHQVLWPEVSEDSKRQELFESMEMPLLPVLSKMERHGVLLDSDMLHKQSHELMERMAEIEKEAYAQAGEAFNLSSPKQIQVILYEKLGLPVLKKTPKKQPSTAETVLQELALDYPLPKLILEYRSLSKLKSTYTEKLPKQKNVRTGRVHTSYHQAVTATGRLSSSDPNLQNIPIRSAEGRRIRQAFIAPQGYKIVAADYSQIELRIMAHLSQDQGLLTAFTEGVDIHRATAAEMFSIAIDEVTTDQRRSAKAINFGLIYGMSAFGLARQLNVDRGVAQAYIDRYFARYPGVKIFMDAKRQEAHDQGYVETVSGRRLYLPDINSRNGQRRQYAERAAINAPMQGTAADIIKLAMINVN
ncbi:MAG TPA: DNA polymerase I, partial [Gammaproteobacteria bacterium]|nr:DNA polymerase I [Gammaproteobacteria bacterium]